MSAETKKFQLSLIRLLKGMLSAWEEWVQSQQESRQAS